MKAKTKTWIEQVESGNLKTNMAIVLDYVIKRHKNGLDSDVYNMRNQLRLAHQTLTGILSMLADEGLIVEIGQVQIDGSTFTRWGYVTDETKRKIIAHNRKCEKYNAWIKRGLSEYGEMMSESVKKELQEIDDFNEALRKIANEIDKSAKNFMNN